MDDSPVYLCNFTQEESEKCFTVAISLSLSQRVALCPLTHSTLSHLFSTGHCIHLTPSVHTYIYTFFTCKVPLHQTHETLGTLLYQNTLYFHSFLFAFFFFLLCFSALNTRLRLDYSHNLTLFFYPHPFFPAHFHFLLLSRIHLQSQSSHKNRRATFTLLAFNFLSRAEHLLSLFFFLSLSPLHSHFFFNSPQQ